MDYKANLFDYLAWRGDVSLQDSPFNEVDGMILARLSYAPFQLVMTEGIQQNGTVLQNRDLVREHYYELSMVMQQLIGHPDIKKEVLDITDIRLFDALSNSNRFKNLYIGNFVDMYDREKEIQFSGFVVKIAEKRYCVVYRGTDNTLIGWKEDLNMGFICPIPSQILAKDYLEDFALHVKGELVIAGHSKGGNLAAYAAAFCEEKIQKRIGTVYNYDGPGFDDSVLETDGYQRICKKIKTYVPQGSLVGMLLGHKEEHQVVHSSELFGPIQHDVYSWEILGPKFVYEDGVNSTSLYVDHAMKDWLSNMDKTQRERFVEAAFSLISETPDKTLAGIRENWLQNGMIILRSLKHMDNESREIIQEGMSLFFKSARNVNIHNSEDTAKE